MTYELPPVDVLAKYMCLLRRVIIEARSKAYDGANSQVVDLLDAVENLPDLLMRWPDLNESILAHDLNRIESTYPEWSHGLFTQILQDGPPPNWQLRWGRSDDPSKPL